MDVLHTAVWVDDLEATREFYLDELGLEFSWEFTGDDGVHNYFVTGESDAEIQFKHDPDRDVEEPAGIDHLAVEVDDTDAVVERVADRGSEVVKGPLTMAETNARIAFVTDPDGYVVELIQYLD
jgi:lactoylglutathione lyase